jgi:hypothetical protein
LVPVPKANLKEAGTDGVAPKFAVPSAFKAEILFVTIGVAVEEGT